MVTQRTILVAGVLMLAAVAACDRSDGAAGLAGPTPPSVPSAQGTASPDTRPQRLARRVARAMRNPAFRAYIKAQLDHSAFREHKLPFQRFLRANGGRGLSTLAGENGEDERGIAGDADSASALEFYFPVARHLSAWTGGENILVATADQDGDVPVAFDIRGRRIVLDARRPPETPVLAIVPVETDFDEPPARAMACIEPDTCGSGGGNTPPPPSGGGNGGMGPGLYMTQVTIPGDYEGWLKGDPEYEVLILGQTGQADSLMMYQCAGEHAGGPYTYDQNDATWTGNVLLFSQTQLDAYKAQHPSQGVRVFFLEDDDAACELKVDPADLTGLFDGLDQAYQNRTGGRDSSLVGTGLRLYRFARAVSKIWNALTNIIKTKDEIIGTAIEDDVVGSFESGYNWFIKGPNTVTRGWVNLEMR